MRGRLPGVKTVSFEMEERRVGWLKNHLDKPGKKAELGRLLCASDSFVSHLLAGRRTFTDALCHKIEDAIGLARGSIDAVTSASFVSRCTAIAPIVKTQTKLDPIVRRALQDMLNKALRENRLSNVVAVKMIEVLILH